MTSDSDGNQPGDSGDHAREAVETVVGLAVLGYQRAQVGRRRFLARLPEGPPDPLDIARAVRGELRDLVRGPDVRGE